MGDVCKLVKSVCECICKGWLGDIRSISDIGFSATAAGVQEHD